MLTKKEFDILDCLAEANEELSQRKISKLAKISVGSVNKFYTSLENRGLIKSGKITERGLELLEPYRVKRAVIMAAGFGSRLVPITLNTPKPLVRVNGKRIIETILDALYDAEIEEIYLVRGYLGTQFDDLLYKYPNIKFIENPKYNEGNNIISVYEARKYIHSAYVMEADLLVYNPAVIKKYQYQTNYLTIPVEETDDWCFFVNKSGIIADYSVGGKNCHKMVGFSYWSEEDGKKLAEDVEKVYLEPGGKERYWDEVHLKYCKKDFKIAVRECSDADVIEIDTFNELKQVDKSYDV